MYTSLELIYLGHTVTGVDKNSQIAEKYVDELTQAVICDATDEHSLRELDLDASDAVVVAIGEDMESSLLCILALKNLGVSEIWVKASTKAHHTIVSKLGVSRIIHPEEEMGIRVAQALNYPMVEDYLSVGHGLYVVEIQVSAGLNESTAGQLLIDSEEEIKVVMVKREQQIFTQVGRDFVLMEQDTLLLCGTREALKLLAPKLG